MIGIRKKDTIFAKNIAVTISDSKLISGEATHYLAEKIAESYGQDLTPVEVMRFSDGEFEPVIQESVRGSFLFCIQSTFAPSDNLMELLLLLDAAKRASAGYIVAVLPYFGLARQDRKDKPRVAIGAKLVANLLVAAGAQRVMTMDLHAPQIQGFFDIPVDHLDASAIFAPYVKSLELEDLMFASPDVGSTKRARSYALQFNADLVICDKFRTKHNEIESMRLIGNVEGKNVILVDDLIDTGGTLCTAANLIMENGAKSVRALITHPVLSGKAYERIEKSALQELVVCDTIPLKQQSEKIKVLSVASLFAKAIRNAHEYRSINSLFIQKK
ncbi:MAG: ribose-phosphate pyrophosphokinase [Chitinophagales bacterium]|nr:ribose-phosphate pyrophosphokinase [Chitinophagales bacterium]HMW95157.1 ribose-phosphate pyrophosphokinase [Chitinophagales bacterium]HMY43146.1 ribose-phosphate pyrophosphokinase [Chitinophagales bacterium]HMZ94533.1 ribose-phosphate pyrophosphokinase [Chitinophagales bacterium]HNB39440.1 ribose-phosphate pyrophosphokinase [Chitinophagales bacterium]